MARTIAAWTDPNRRIMTSSSEDGLTWDAAKRVEGIQTNFGPSVTYHPGDGKYYLVAIGALKANLRIFEMEEGKDKEWKDTYTVQDEHYSDYAPSIASDGVNLIVSWIGAEAGGVNILVKPNDVKWEDAKHTRVPEAISRNASALSTNAMPIPHNS